MDKQTDMDQSPKYWLSIEQWKNDPAFQELAEKEFLSSPLSEGADKDGGWARREFLKLMGASLALTSFGCVRRPAQKIIPYAKRPEEVVQGITNYYASSFVDGHDALGTLVSTREGRPIKIDGNESHPSNAGGMSARAHSHVLSLYDPARMRAPKKNLRNPETLNYDSISTTWDNADKEIVAEFKKGKVAILTGASFSPATRNLISQFSKTFGAKTYTWEPLSMATVKKGRQLSFGNSAVPMLKFSKAKYILTIDTDILGTYLAPTQANREFAEGRRPGEGMNKLVAFESLLSLTGANADTRIRIRASQQLDVIMGLLYKIVTENKMSRYANDTQVGKILSGYKDAANEVGVEQELFDQIAKDLWENKGQSIVVAGGPATEGLDAEALQVATNFLNTVLGNEGETIVTQTSMAGASTSDNEILDLVKAIEAGEIKRLVIHGVNPGYALPLEAGFREAMKKVELLVYTGDRIDETGSMSHFVLPDHHAMENWSDIEIIEGVYSIQQPTIRPMYDTRAFQDSLISWVVKGGGSVGAESWYDYMRNHWKNSVYAQNRTGIAKGDFNSFWVSLLQDGVFDTESKKSRSTSFNTSSLKIAEKKETPHADFELVLYPTVGLKDGSMANVSWLQEFPDPVTKICWDNYLSVSPKVAADMKLKEGQIVELMVSGKTVKVPVHIQPGTNDHVVGLALGYGRTHAGDVADGVGIDAYKLAAVENGKILYSGLSAKIKPTTKMYPLANTQGHHSMEGRQIVVEATLKDYLKNEEAGIHRHKVFTAWSKIKYEGRKWGMTVDLNSCTGCGACVIACQSENNVSTVGKKYVLEGREMHWIRIDRYYTGTPDEPGVVNMPVMCQHCDNAPCETVCPALATVHGDEGTNDMIYNRCIGTRYCANNCPYKVRRFNWFNYTNVESPLHMAMNPEVTVRSRGVMEKCTFCSHKIAAAKNVARHEKREVKDGDVITACQASCPTKAIVFGDMHDKDSKVAASYKDKRNYTLLEELNNVPAVQYKSKIRNTNKIKSHGGKGHHGEQDSEGGHA